MRFLFTSEESQLPLLRRHVVSENVDSAAVVADFEVAVVRREPAVDDFRDFDARVRRAETARGFLSAPAGVALHRDRSKQRFVAYGH